MPGVFVFFIFGLAVTASLAALVTAFISATVVLAALAATIPLAAFATAASTFANRRRIATAN